MAKKNRFIAVLMLAVGFTLPAPSTAQGQNDGATIQRRYVKGLVVQKNRKRIEARDLRFEGESLEFTNIKSSQSSTIPLDSVQIVRAQVGTNAAEGALVGGGLMLLSAVSAVLQKEAEPNTTVTNGSQVILISTAIGLAGGLIIGSMIAKEEIVYKNGRFVMTPAPASPGGAPMPDRRITLLALSYRF